MKNYKTQMIPVKCSRSDMDYLYECNKLSAEVWNICLELSSQYYQNNDRKMIDRNDLQKQTKKCVPLHAKGIHHVVHKYLFARDAMFKSIKAGTKKVKLPYRKKKYYTTGWDCQAIKADYARGVIILQKPYIQVDGKKKTQKPVKCFSKAIPQNIVEVELIYKDRLYLAVKYIEQIEYIQIQSNNQASIDLGEIHSITSIDNNQNAIIITGRRIREIKQHRNRLQGKIFRKMSKCKIGSNQYKKYMRALGSITTKYDQKILDSVHKITKHYVDYCLKNNISTVYYGDLDSATRDIKKNKIANRRVRQKLSQWNYGQIVRQLEDKLMRYGVKLEKVKEYYTSQKCPSCKELNKPSGRCYICKKCSYHQHRDIVGAINILNDNGGFQLTHYRNKTYLQID